MANNPHPTLTRQQDPIFAALRKERQAYEAFLEALNELARAGAFSSDPPSDDMIEMQEERLPRLEAEEARASAALIEAERSVLATKPTTIQGAAALLGFLRRHLSEDPDIQPVIEAISMIEELFGDPELIAISTNGWNCGLPQAAEPDAARTL